MSKAYRDPIEYWGWVADLMVRKGDVSHGTEGCQTLSVGLAESQTPFVPRRYTGVRSCPRGVGLCALVGVPWGKPLSQAAPKVGGVWGGGREGVV